MPSSNSPAIRRFFASPLTLSAGCALVIFLRNVWLFWQYSYAYYPDSDLYVHSGAGFFRLWQVASVATFPYPLLNALTASSVNPTALIWVQILFASLTTALLVYWVARSERLLALVVGLLLAADVTWGAYTRAILTDGVFAGMHLLGIALLYWHYQRRFRLPLWEALLAGLFFGLMACIRPSNIFLAILIPPAYFWLARSWKPALAVAAGIGVFFLIVGLINLKGTQKFYILSSSGGHGSDFIAFPLLVNRLFSPENGPVSRTIDGYLQACYPGLDYAQAVDRSEGMAIDSVNNMDFIMRQVFPCIQEQKAAHHDERNLFPMAYVEALVRRPLEFTRMVVRETALFLRYSNPSVINWLLDPAQNYGCTDLAWCDQITTSRSALSGSAPLVQLYEKAAAKLLQAYLAPLGLLSRVFPGDPTLPVATAWLAITALTLIFSTGSERLLFLSAAVVILYTAVFVVVGYGFTERYPSMLSPIQALYSAVVWFVLGRALWRALAGVIRRGHAPRV